MGAALCKMTEPRVSPVARDSEVAEGMLCGVYAGDVPVLLIRLNGIIHAIGRICTHEYADLADGELDDGCVVCPLHGSRFDITTGRALTLPATLPEPVYAVTIVAGVIYVAVPPDG